MKKIHLLPLIFLLLGLMTHFSVFAQEEHQYSYHPWSILHLGTCFDRNDLTDPCRQGITYKIDTTGSKSSTIKTEVRITLIENEKDLIQKLNIDAKASAHFLKFNASAYAGYFKTESLNEKSLTLLITGSSIFPNIQLKDVCLIPEAQQLLDSKNYKDFRTRFGTGYVSEIVKGGSIFVLLTIKSMDNETYQRITGGSSASFDSKKVGVKFNIDLAQEISKANRSGMLDIEIKGTGGPAMDDLSKLVKDIKSQDSSYYKIFNTISLYMNQFNFTNSVPITFITTSFTKFGYPTDEDIWSVQKDRSLENIVVEYYKAINLMDNLKMITGDSRYNYLITHEKRKYYEFVISDLSNFLDSLASLHTSIKKNIDTIIIEPKLKYSTNILPTIPHLNICCKFENIDFFNKALNSIYIYDTSNIVNSFSIIKNIKIYLSENDQVVIDFSKLNKLQPDEMLSKVMVSKEFNGMPIINLFDLFPATNYGLPDNFSKYINPFTLAYQDKSNLYTFKYTLEIVDIFGTSKYNLLNYIVQSDINNNKGVIPEWTCQDCFEISPQKIFFEFEPVILSGKPDTIFIAYKPIIGDLELDSVLDYMFVKIPSQQVGNAIQNNTSSEFNIPPFMIYKSFEVYWGDKSNFEISPDNMRVIKYRNKKVITLNKKPYKGTIKIN